MSRYLPTSDYLKLKSAFRRLIKHCGGYEAASEATRVAYQTLQKYASSEHPEIFAPADVVADLEAVADNPIVSEVLARLNGFVLVRAGGAETGQQLATAKQDATAKCGAAIAALNEDDSENVAETVRAAATALLEVDRCSDTPSQHGHLKQVVS